MHTMPSFIAARCRASASIPFVRSRRAIRAGLSAMLALVPLAQAFAAFAPCDTPAADCEILYSRTYTDPNTYDYTNKNSLDLMSTSAGSPTITQLGGTVLTKQLALWNNVSYNMSGGTANITGDTIVTIYSSGAVSSSFTQSGGTMNMGGNLRFALFNGNTGTYTLSGGNVNVGGNVNLVASSGTNAAAYLYLNGGTLTANQIVRDGDSAGQQTTAELRFNGGTLRAKGDADNPNWINFNNGWDRRYQTTRLAIDAGGAIFDTNGRNMGIQQPLPVSWSLGSPQTPAISGGGVTKRGAGTLTLSAGNAYTGNTTIEGGTLTLANVNAAVNSTVLLNAGTLSFDAIANSTLGGLGGSQNFTLQNTGNAAVALAVGNNGASTTYSGVMNGSGSLTKFGGGTLTLGGNNSYGGATAVNAGTLRVNGTTGTGALSVANGATLSGGGRIGGAATVQNGGHLAPGNSPGTLTFANGLNLNGGAVLDLELGSSSDLVRVSAGVFGAAAGVKINLADSGGFGFGSYTLVDFSGATPSGIDPANFTFGTTISGPYLYRLSVQGSKLVLNVGPIPPVVTGVTVPLADVYGIGRLLDFTLRFSKAVTVTGTPRLPIALTSGTIYANYVSGSGSTDLLFRTIVTGGNSDNDGIALAAALDANGGTLRDAAGTDADPALNGVPSTAGVKVDGIMPTTTAIRLVGTPPPQSVAISYTVTFSEPVTGVDAADFAVETIDGNATGQIGTVSGSGNTYTVPVRGIGGVGTLFVTLKSAGTGIADAAGNPILGGYRLADSFQANVELRCYVDAMATGANDGTRWADAYTDLQAAVSNAGCVEIWAAKGVYKPGTARGDSFRPRAGVELYGGFAGGEASLAQRTPEVIAAHPTVMSGDIDGNDATDADGVVLDAAQIAGGNSKNVVLMNNAPASGFGADTVIDGFIITAGDASVGGSGGGLRCDVPVPSSSCSFTLTNMVFSGNRALAGGALSVSGNNGNSAPAWSKILFRGNRATYDAGAVSLSVTDAAGSLSPTFSNVVFSDNTAPNWGGAIGLNVNLGSLTPTFDNVTFVNNISGARRGGALASQAFGGGTSRPTLRNAILWGDAADAGDPEIVLDGSGTAIIDHSIVQSGCPGGTATCTNLIAGDPKLGALGDHGGATPSLLPGADGSAIDTGTCQLQEDQRGIARPQGGGCDVGAAEYRQSSLTANVNGGGRVSAGTPPAPLSGGIAACADSCSAIYDGETSPTVALTATPNPYQRFTGWSGDCSGTDPVATVAMTTARTCTADFTPILFTVSPSVDGGHGSIDPSEAFSIAGGTTTSFTLTPDANYHVAGVDGSCGGSLSGTLFTTNAVIADCTVAARFAIDRHMVTPGVTEGLGSVDPADPQLVDHDATAQFVLIPAPNYHVAGVDGSCGGSLSGSGNTIYTTDAVIGDCTFAVRFAIDQRAVASSVAGGHGAITPAGLQLVDYGTVQQFVLMPDANYHVDGVESTCGGSLSGTVYTTNAVIADCTVVARFAIDRHTVTPSAGDHGTISPPTPQLVDHGTTTQFTLTPDVGYHVASVDGTCGGSLSGTVYTTNAVIADCTVVAHFAIDRHTVTPSVAGEHGSISPSAPQQVDYGATAQFTVTPAPHYHVDAMGGSCGGQLVGSTYTTDPIVADCDVTAQFAIDTHTIGGGVSGLLGAGLVLQLNGANDLAIAANGSFTFASPLDDLSAYVIAIAQQPTSPAQQCVVMNGSGVLDGSDVTDILVHCDPPLPHLIASVGDDRSHARYGMLLNYTVTVSNDGEGDASGITVRDLQPPQIDAAAMSWICTGAGGAATCTPSGSGPLLDAAVSIPAGGSLTWQVTAPVRADAPGASVDYEVDVSGPATASALDSDLLVLLRTGFDVIGSDGAESTGASASCRSGVPQRSLDATATFAFDLPAASGDRIDSVLRADSADGAGVRVERLDLGDEPLLRLVARGRDGVERASAWAQAGSTLVLGIASAGMDASLLLEGTMPSLEIELTPDTGTQFGQLSLLDDCR